MAMAKTTTKRKTVNPGDKPTGAELRTYSPYTAQWSGWEGKNGYEVGEQAALHGKPMLTRDDMYKQMSTKVVEGPHGEELVDYRWDAYQRGYNDVVKFDVRQYDKKGADQTAASLRNNKFIVNGIEKTKGQHGGWVFVIHAAATAVQARKLPYGAVKSNGTASKSNPVSPRVQRVIATATPWAELVAYSEHDAGRTWGGVQKYYGGWAKRHKKELGTLTPAERQHVKLEFAKAFAAEKKKVGQSSNPTKLPSEMSATEINKALDRLDAESSKITDAFIAAGRGNERPSEIRNMADPLAARYNDNARKFQALRIEMERRYGPGTPSRLPKGFKPLKHNGKRTRSNPMDAADAMFESFHGEPPTETLEFHEDIHVHHNLASCGDLVGFKVRVPSGRDATIEGFESAVLTTNEKGTHMYVRGGDQCIDIEALGITDTGKESVIIGLVWCVAYETEKDFDDFEPIQYVHLLGEEKYYRGVKQGKNLWGGAKPPKPAAFTPANLPTLRYSTIDQLVYLDGGIYKIERPLVGTSPGIEG